MISVIGYSDLEIIHQSAETIVYAARRENDGARVVLRQLRPEIASPSMVASYRKEFELLASIDSPYVIKAEALLEQQNIPILVTEHIGGDTLADLLRKRTIPVREAIRIAIAVASGLDDLHASHIIHKDISPTNIVYNPVSGELRIIDLGIATLLSTSTVKVEPSRLIEGTLAYLAPEQTGRMNRTIDYRADLYALGATLYELLTGGPPFPTEDSLELVYNHIATMPMPPATLNPSIPPAVSQIVMKLLAKMPEDRYQSTYAILNDLNRCLVMADTPVAPDGPQPTFEVALDDIPEQLNISERLLEREAEQAVLKSVLAEVADGATRVVICTGEAGIGKSALVQDLHKDVAAVGGYHVTSRHNLMSTESPYTIVSNAGADLIRQLLAQPDIEAIRHRVRNALGGNLDILLELVPELQLLLEQPAPPPQEHLPSESRHRLIHALSELLRSICSERKPFVINIENLHWIDSASLELFEPIVMQQKIPYLMIVCTLRPSELARANEVQQELARILLSNPQITSINIRALSTRSISTIISESLYRPVEETQKLAEIVRAKTNGNPLAVREFLYALQRSEAIMFDREHREWTWDLAQVNLQPPTENVGTLLAERIEQLEPATAHLLKIASCAGHEFDLDMISNVSQLSLSETSARLLHAAREGYLVSTSSSIVGSKAIDKIRYQFSHERIQQAAYTLLNKTQRRQIHTRIGQEYLVHSDDQPDNIFAIVNQLNNSLESSETTFVDKKKLAELNFTAGRKAKRSAAFQSSFKYFKTAIALYGPEVWSEYELSLNLHLEAAETAYLCGDSNQLELLIARAVAHARNPLDLSRVHEIKLRALIAFNDLDTAVALGHEVLDTLGVPLKKPINSLRGTLLTLSLLYRTARISEDDVANAKPMTDPVKLATMRILMVLCQAGYLTGSLMTGLYILKMTQLSLRHGMAPESSFVYPMFGALLIAHLGTIESGYRFGMLASSNLNESNKELHCKTLTLVSNFIRIWKHPIKESLEPLKSAYRVGMETGDVEFALIAAIAGTANAFLLGHDLNSLDVNFTSYNQKASEFNQTPILSIGSIYQQAIRNLLNPAPAPWLLEGDVYSENQLLQFHEDTGDESSIATLFILKLFLAVLFNRSEHAVEFAREARAKILAVVSSPAVPLFVLYESLALVSRLPHVKPLTRLRYRLRIRRNQRHLRKWAFHAPENILHGYHLVEAEISRVRGDTARAMDHYELAIKLSAQHGFLNEHGIANEMTGRFHVANGKRELGLFYLRNARATFVRWGAMNKVSALDDEFMELAEQGYFDRTRNFKTSGTIGNLPSSDFHSYGNFLDLGSVIKASQVLSGEIILESLIERLMQVALENAGAHSASLILSRDQELFLEITARKSGANSEYHRESIPVAEATSLPVSVVQYVARTQEDLVLNDALNEDIFTQDDYIISRQPKSILCIPILSKSHLTGVLYLENLQTTLAFTQDRVAILKLLASQSAIAIENAKLYQQLNDSRDKYLSLYKNAVEGIFELDQRGRIINVNPAAAHLMGFDSAEFAMEQKDIDLSSIFIDQAKADHVRQALTTEGRLIGFECQIRRRDGGALWVALSAQLFQEENNEGEFRIEGSIIDITERKLREEAEHATRVAEAATESKSQFLANMSHEVRTPMNAIVGYTDLALRTKLTEQQSSYLETIRTSSNHLLRVVNDILDLSKIESGKLELQRVPFKLNDILKDLHNLFGFEAGERGLVFNAPTREDLNDVYFVGDPVRIGQVLINLVSNALKFTDTGEISIEFEPITLNDERVCINFAVADTGMGVHESQLESIFESFVQGNLTSRNSGTGLGLAICKNLVEMMDGHIHAVSQMDEGSTFYFSVVVDPWAEKTVPSYDDRPESVDKLDGQRVLLVEDNRINQDLAREVLTNAGLLVEVADNGQEALDKLAHMKYYAVLMDLRMPVMDGIDAVKHIRANRIYENLPVIALSAGVLKNEVEEALASGFNHYLSKPIDFEELLALLRAIGGVTQAKDGFVEAQPLPSPPVMQREIDGVDFGRALKNHANDDALLLRLMTDFIKIYASADQQMIDFIATDDFTRAERLAHNIAGVSGSFGATGLMTAARAIEHRLIAQEADYEGSLTDLTRELHNFVQAIEQYQQEQDTSASSAVF